MSLISLPFIFTVGQTIVASSHNSDFQTIYNDYNGNITTANISASAGITDNQLAQITSSNKVNTSALTGSLAGLAYAVPQGGIIMWFGSIATIPSGWLLCDGNNSTPDLRNRFIVGADADVTGVANSTITGSPLQTSEGQLPTHAHSVATGQPSGGNGTFYYLDANSPGASNGSVSTHNTNSFGTGTANVARFYALAYIMKS